MSIMQQKRYTVETMSKFFVAMWMNAWLFTIMIAAIIRDHKTKTGNEIRFTGPYREENRKYPLGSQRNPIPEPPHF